MINTSLTERRVALATVLLVLVSAAGCNGYPRSCDEEVQTATQQYFSSLHSDSAHIETRSLELRTALLACSEEARSTLVVDSGGNLLSSNELAILALSPTMIDVDAIGERERGDLMVRAAMFANADTLQALLDRNFDSNFRDARGRSPFEMTAGGLYDPVPKARVLLSGGARVPTAEAVEQMRVVAHDAGRHEMISLLDEIDGRQGVSGGDTDD